MVNVSPTYSRYMSASGRLVTLSNPVKEKNQYKNIDHIRRTDNTSIESFRMKGSKIGPIYEFKLIRFCQIQGPFGLQQYRYHSC